jgi:hypothetical protein
VIEPDRMTDLMRDRVANVVNVEVAVETSFQSLVGLRQISDFWMRRT